MAGTLLALLDDIATMTKVAASKTAGVLGDDLALNAEQVSGVKPARELPVVWAVAKGSLKNKVILAPAALLISAIAPWAIIPLLMIGGLFLCYEGFEKIFHKLLMLLPGHKEQQVFEAVEKAELAQAIANPEKNLVEVEKNKIKGAIRTDFILSAEILVITLGTVSDATLVTKLGVMVLISIIMTVGVYGLVAGIVKIDDTGMKLIENGGAQAKIGRGILVAAPWMMKALSIVGTAAMFLVGGGILVHGLPFVEGYIHDLSHVLHFPSLMAALFNGVFGVIAGGIAVFVIDGALAAWKAALSTPNQAS